MQLTSQQFSLYSILQTFQKQASWIKIAHKQSKAVPKWDTVSQPQVLCWIYVLNYKKMSKR